MTVTHSATALKRLLKSKVLGFGKVVKIAGTMRTAVSQWKENRLRISQRCDGPQRMCLCRHKIMEAAFREYEDH